MIMSDRKYNLNFCYFEQLIYYFLSMNFQRLIFCFYFAINSTNSLFLYCESSLEIAPFFNG